VTLGSVISSTLPLLRSQAESMMLDTCEVYAPGSGGGTWDDDTGTWTPPTTTLVYKGRCQLPKVNPNAADADTQESQWAKGLVPIRLPARKLDGDQGDPLAVADGHTLVVTSRDDLTFDVRFVVPQTFEKSRQVQCEMVSRDA